GGAHPRAGAAGLGDGADEPRQRARHARGARGGAGRDGAAGGGGQGFRRVPDGHHGRLATRVGQRGARTPGRDPCRDRAAKGGL
ncbi:MAG: FIG140336: TPR domain protein, partial [uncultured Sphingomonas sp.]